MSIRKSLPLASLALLAPALASAQAGSCPGPQVTIASPAAIAGDYRGGAAAFGPGLDTIGVTADIVLADDGAGEATDACEPIVNDVTGAIVLIDRGTCSFVTKVRNAELAGAAGAIIANNAGDDVITMGDDGTGGDITVPSVFIGQTDGGTLRSEPDVVGTILIGEAFQSPQARCDRPIPMGVSGSTVSEGGLYSGTLGMKVRSLANPERKFILSNNHVMAIQNPTLCPNSAEVPIAGSQPSGGDLGFNPGLDPEFLIGATTRFVPMVAPGDNRVDAALVATNDTLSSNEIINIGVPTAAVVQPMVGMPVIKSGRTTGTTEATITAVGVTSNVNYGAGCDVYRFVGQIQITNPPGVDFSSGGDSGSAILNSESLIPVGLLFAGSDTSTIANPMPQVWRATRTFPDAGDAAPLISEAEAMQRIDAAMRYPAAVQRLMDVQAQVQDGIFANRGVVAMGVGRNEAGTDYAFVISVDKLTPRLRAALPHRINGVPVRILETGEMRALPLRSGPPIR
jgi:hypothetical protein